MRASGKNGWILLLLILGGVVLGGFVGSLAKDISWLSWLNYGSNFGLGSPDGSAALQLDLGFLIVTFGFSIRFTIASIIGIIAAILVYRKI